MTHRTKRILAIIGLVIVAGIILINTLTRVTNAITSSTKKDSVYTIDLQTAAEIHYRHIETGNKPDPDMKIVYEAKTDGMVIYTVRSSDDTIESRVVFVLDELWEELK